MTTGKDDDCRYGCYVGSVEFGDDADSGECVGDEGDRDYDDIEGGALTTMKEMVVTVREETLIIEATLIAEATTVAKPWTVAVTWEEVVVEMTLTNMLVG